jgi:RNA polymerase sigma factor for flagellar operon FliA
VEARELLTTHLATVERAIAFACRRYRLDPDNAEEFGSVVKLRLVENDYAILRAWEGRSAFATFISIVVQRMALDYRIHEWGKWHASAEAKRLGDVAIELEQILHRDGRSLDDALTILSSKHAGITRRSLEQLAERLPARGPRHRDVALDDADPAAAGTVDAVEERVLDDERRRRADRLSALLEAAMQKLPDDDRLILRLRFEQGMTVAQISRALQRDQKLLYRQIERRMKEMRADLLHAGVVPIDVLDLIGRDEAFLDLDLGKAGPRPSITNDEKVATQSEGT